MILNYGGLQLKLLHDNVARSVSSSGLGHTGREYSPPHRSLSCRRCWSDERNDSRPSASVWQSCWPRSSPGEEKEFNSQSSSNWRLRTEWLLWFWWILTGWADWIWILKQAWTPRFWKAWRPRSVADLINLLVCTPQLFVSADYNACEVPKVLSLLYSVLSWLWLACCTSAAESR